jgi:23S rRNA (guanine1835-N2)-methyltransferase
VLNNPPFHENHAIGDATAWQMFTESRDWLQPGGELWVVGNRHLAYHAKLKRRFGKCDGRERRQIRRPPSVAAS